MKNVNQNIGHAVFKASVYIFVGKYKSRNIRTTETGKEKKIVAEMIFKIFPFLFFLRVFVISAMSFLCNEWSFD